MPIPWAQILGAGIGGLGALFGGGSQQPEWTQMPGANEQVGQMRDAGWWAYGQKSRGSKFANWWLAQLMGKKGGDAAEIADVERDVDMSMALEAGANPHLATRARQIAVDRARQRQGTELEGWVTGMTGQMAGLSEGAKANRVENRMQAENAALAGWINSHALPGQSGDDRPAWQRYLGGAAGAWQNRNG
jgi:hypothetical protein